MEWQEPPVLALHKCYACRKPVHRQDRYYLRVQPYQDARMVTGHSTWSHTSKKGISANQLHRTLGVTLKTAWFMGHRIRLAMHIDDGAQFGEGGGTVEADETFIGTSLQEAGQGSGLTLHKHKVLVIARP